MRAHYGENEIKSLLQKIRIFDKQIGTYQLFAITENFDYAVKLSNGKILLKLEDLQDEERDALTPERLQTIAKRFNSTEQKKPEPSASQTHSHNTVTTTPLQTERLERSGSVGKPIAIVVVILLVIIGGIAFLVRDSPGEKTTYYTGSSYEEKVMSVEEIERENPTRFLSADGNYRENLWGDKYVIQCSITNNATVASYKDAVIRVFYYTKTGTSLGSIDHTVYEIFSPSSTRTVEFKIDRYKNTSTLSWDVVSARNY